jgi:hypothetical protein
MEGLEVSDLFLLIPSTDRELVDEDQAGSLGAM